MVSKLLLNCRAKYLKIEWVHFCIQYIVKEYTGWFRLNAQNCVPGNSSRRFFELDHEILHTYSGRQYLKLEEGGFFIWGFAVEISGF